MKKMQTPPIFLMILLTLSFLFSLFYFLGIFPGIQKALAQEEEPAPRTLANDLGMTFLYIEPGIFMMGSPESEESRDLDEQPHRVTLTRAFYLQTTEVTQAQWQKVMGDNPSFFRTCGGNCPVENISWEEAKEFVRRLNKQEGTDKYRLPFEAEWEYACRSGTTTPHYTGECITTEQANYNGNYFMSGCTVGIYRKTTVPVASFEPNPWGLYDMHGNVWEWCEDFYNDYPKEPVTDPFSNPPGSFRVARGGSWYCVPANCRSASRDKSDPIGRYRSRGLRLARDP